MTSQQTVCQRRQRRTRRQIDQLTILIEQEISRSLQYEQYIALWTLRELLAKAIRAMRDEVHDITGRQELHHEIQ